MFSKPAGTIKETYIAPGNPPAFIPEGWIAMFHPSYCLYYFVSVSTGQSQWELPPIHPPDNHTQGWITLFDWSSQGYYFLNRSTHKTQWECPICLRPVSQGHVEH